MFHPVFDIGRARSGMSKKVKDQLNELQKDYTEMKAIADTYGRVKGINEVYYDVYNGRNSHSRGKMDTFIAQSFSALTSGDVSIKLDRLTREDGTEIEIGRQVTIYDGDNKEENIVVGIDRTTSRITLLNPLQNNYAQWANVARSSMKVQDGKLRFRGWEHGIKQTVAQRWDSFIANTQYTISDSGEKIVKADNGWHVAIARDSSLVRLFISKDEGLSWNQAFTISWATSSSCALAIRGDTAYVLVTRLTACYCGRYNIITGDWAYKTIDSGLSSPGDGSAIYCDQNNGYLYAVWTGKTTTYANSFNLRFAMSIDGGLNWVNMANVAAIDQITTQNSSTSNFSKPVIIVKDGKPIVVTQYVTGSNYYILGYYHNGTAWTQVNIYVGGTYVQESPKLDMSPDGYIHLVWRGMDSIDTAVENVRYCRSIDGITWTKLDGSAGHDKITSGNTIAAGIPDIVSDENNNLYIGFHQKFSPSDTITGIKIRVYNKILQKWSSVTPLGYNPRGSISTVGFCKNAKNFKEPVFIYSDTYSTAIRFHNIYGRNSINVPEFVSPIEMDISYNNAQRAVKDSKGNIWLIGMIDVQIVCYMRDVETGCWYDMEFPKIPTYSQYPASVIIDENDIIHVFWSGKDSVYSNYQLKYSKFEAGVWTPYQNIQPIAGYDQLLPSVKLHNGKFYMIWFGADSTYASHRQVKFCKFENGVCTPWKNISPITGYALYTAASMVVTDDGEIHVVWTQTDPTYTPIAQLKYSKSVDDGDTFISYRNIYTATYSQQDVHIQTDGSGLYLTWAGSNATYPNSGNIYFMKSLDKGLNWTKMDGTAGADNVTANNTLNDDCGRPVMTINDNDEIFISTRRIQAGVYSILQYKYESTLASWVGELIHSGDTNVQDNVCYVDNQGDTATPLMLWQDRKNNTIRFRGSLLSENITSTIVANYAGSTIGNGGRRLVRLDNGWFVALIFKGGSTSYEFYVSKNNMRSWKRLCYHVNASDVDYGSICSYGNTVFALLPFSTTSIFAYRIDAETQTDTAITSVGQPEASQTYLGRTTLTVDSNGILHGCADTKNSTYANSTNLRYYRSYDGGVTWTVTQLTSQNTAGRDITNPCIILRNDIPYVFSARNYSDDTYNAIRMTYWNGSAWSGDVYGGVDISPTNLGYSQSIPNAIVDKNGAIHCVWQGKDSTEAAYQNLRYVCSTDGGTTWSAMLKITTGNTVTATYPSLVYDKDNNLYVVFHKGDLYRNQLHILRYDGVKWSSSNQLTFARDANQAFPQVCETFHDFIGIPAMIWEDDEKSQVRSMINMDSIESIPIKEEFVRYNIDGPTQKITAHIEHDKELDITAETSIVGDSDNELFTSMSKTVVDIDSYRKESSYFMLTKPVNNKVTLKMNVKVPQINLLNKGGDCESTAYWTTGGTLSLDFNNKKFGNSSMKVTSTVVGAFGGSSLDIAIDDTKYYSVSAYLRNIDATSMELHWRRGSDSSAIPIVTGITSTDFIKVSGKLSPTDLQGEDTIRVYLRGQASVIGQSFEYDGVVLTEITEEEYNDPTYIPEDYMDTSEKGIYQTLGGVA